MSLSRADLTFDFAFSLLKEIAGFKDLTYPDRKTYSVQFDSATYDRLFAKRFTLAAAATETIDLSSFEDIFGDTKSMTEVAALVMLPSGEDAAVKLEPGATNGLVWFFSGTTPAITLPTGSLFVVSQTTSQAIDGTHKTLKFTSAGSDELTLDVLLVGGS